LFASVAWIVVVGAYAVGFFVGDVADGPQPHALSAMLFLIGALGPVAMMGFAAMMLARTEALRDEIAALRAAPAEAADGPRRARQSAEVLKHVAARLDAIERHLAARTQDPELTAARVERRTAAPRQEARADQPALPFADSTAEAPPIPWADIVRALDFPRDQGDAAGFEAVRSAIRDPDMARLLQAAEDVLGMLAMDGLHMEDFAPELGSLAAWRAYGEGTRGAAVAAVGGIHDPALLDKVQAKLRSDSVFRDAALVFVRRWNGLVTRILAEVGEDRLLHAIADTRSGRAFMIVARATGAFR
jgi:hypothetical protein